MRPIVILTGFMACLLSLNSCAMGSKLPSGERKLQQKMWHLCHPTELKNHEDKNPIGKVCNNVCIKRKKRKCKVMKRTVKDLTKKEDFLFFRSSSFVLINENQLK